MGGIDHTNGRVERALAGATPDGDAHPAGGGPRETIDSEHTLEASAARSESCGLAEQQARNAELMRPLE